MPNTRDQETRKVPKRIFQAMLGATLLALGMATWTAFWMAQRTNDLARENSVRLFTASLQSKLDNLAATAGALGREHLTHDAHDNDHAEEMAEAVQGVSMSDRRIDLSLLFTPDGRLLNSYTSADLRDPIALAQTEGVVELLSHLTESNTHKLASFVRIEGKLVLIAVVDTIALAEKEGLHVHFEQYEDLQNAGTIVAVGHILTEQELRDLGGLLALSEVSLLALDAPTEPRTTELILTGANELPMARISWLTPRPGQAALNDVLPFMGYLSIILFGGTVIVARVSARQAQDVIEERQRARHDELTGLLNRSGMVEYLRGPDIAKAPRRGQAAVIYMDLNDFKTINDQMGHEVGDLALQEIARRLQGAARKEDRLVRVGGDEFICLLHGTDISDAARLVANRMSEVCVPQVALPGRSYALRPAIGVAIAVPGDTWQSLVRAADATMYQAKGAKRTEPLFSAGSDTMPPGRVPLPIGTQAPA